MASFMKKAMPMMSCRKFFSKSGTKRSLFSQRRKTTRLDGHYRPATCHRPVATAAGIFSRARALRKTSNPGITNSAPRRPHRHLCLNDLRKFLKKSIRAIASFTTRSRRIRFFQWTKPQRNCRCYTRPAWDREDTIGTGTAKTHSRTQAAAAQSVSRKR